MRLFMAMFYCWDEDNRSGSGVVFSQVSGTGVDGDRYYARLLSGTDLGLPITDPNTNAIWDAKLKGNTRNIRSKSPLTQNGIQAPVSKCRLSLMATGVQLTLA